MTSATKLKTSAMIASIVSEGQRTKPAPFGHALVELARSRPDIVGMTADLGKYTDMHIFAQAFPDRFYQMGMAEQLLFGAAAGIPDEEAEKMLPPFLWEQADDVARTAIDGLEKGRGVIVPGAPNRAAAFLYRYAPHRALLPLLGRGHPGRNA